MDKLIGYRRFTGKNGKSYCVANVTSDFSPRDVANGAAGLAVKEVFLPDNLLDYLKPADVDKECHLEYEITGSRAFLVGFSVVGHK